MIRKWYPGCPCTPIPQRLSVSGSDSRISGFQDLKIPGVQDFNIAGFEDFRIPGFNDFRIAGILKFWNFKKMAGCS